MNGPYNAQLGGLRAGLMGTQMPDTYGSSMPNPGYQPAPMLPGQAGGFHLPQSHGADNLGISRGGAGMHDAFEMARKNPVGHQQHYTSLADDIQQANSGQGSGQTDFSVWN